MSQNLMTRHATTTAGEGKASFQYARADSALPASRSTATGIGEWIRRIAFSTAPPATLLVRAIVGAVFLLEGLLKFLNPQELGVGRFIKIGIPFPSFFAPFDGVFEIGCGILLMLGLLTRLCAIPMIINMIVAITSTKIPLLLHEGFWKAAHEARLDVSMLLGCIFLLIVGAGPLSLDSLLVVGTGHASSGPRRMEDEH
jgi:putative oxidoreductase